MSTNTKTVEELEAELQILKDLVAKSIVIDTTATEAPAEPKGPGLFNRLANKTKKVVAVPVTVVATAIDERRSFSAAKAALHDQMVAEGAALRAAQAAHKAAQEAAEKAAEEESNNNKE